MNNQIESQKSRDSDKEAVIAKYSSVIFKMKAEISKLTTDKQSLSSQLAALTHDCQSAKLEAENAVMMSSQLQKMLSTQNNAANSHSNRENDLKIELNRLETEKNEFYAQIKRLESSLDSQQQREAEFKKKLRERDQRAEEDRTIFSLQVQSRNKMVEEILSLQGQQQSEISTLQMRIDDAKLRAETSNKNWSAVVLKEQVEKADLQKKLFMAEEMLESEKQGHIREVEQWVAQVDAEREKTAKEVREAKLLLLEHKKVKKELGEAVRKAETMSHELEVKHMQCQSQTEKFTEADDRQRQKEKLWQQEVDFLKSQMAKAVADHDEAIYESKKRMGEDAGERLQELLTVQAKLKAEQLDHQAKVRLLEVEKNDLKSRVASLESAKVKCSRCDELMSRLTALQSERKGSVPNPGNPKGMTDRMSTDNDHLADRLIKYKSKVKGLMVQNDELKNANQFFESKIEKLEKRMIDLIYGDTVEQRAAEESERLRIEVHRDLTRTQIQE